VQRVTDVLDAVTSRTALVVEALAEADLDAASALPGWSRLTIACHLRFGAEAMRRMTDDALAGRPAAYYPTGRATQRPETLLPRGDEDVVASLREASAALDRRWAAVSDWQVTVVEPDDNVDLGPYPLQHMPLFRLTEIEVHGTDLDLGLPPWSDTLVHAALPMRLERLTRRRALRPGAWRLVATDGPWETLETVVGDGAEPEVLAATGRELFALTLGRSSACASFSEAYPGP
jgi:maleylpyruvate isomerase